MLSRVGSIIWIADWSDKSTEDDADINNNFYLLIYSSFSLVFGLMAFIRVLLFTINGANSANVMHFQQI